MKLKGKEADVIDQGKDLIAFYRQNPCIAAYDLLRADLAPVQRIIFEDMWFKTNTISVCGRGAGKTFLLGLLSTLSCLLFPGYRVGLIGPVFRQCFLNDINNLHTFWTDNGLKVSTHEFYDSIQPGITETQSLKTQNIIRNKWKNDVRECVKIKTRRGFEVGGTVDHQILVLDDTYDLVYKLLKDISDNDYLVIKRGFRFFGKDTHLPKFNFDLKWGTKDCRIPSELTVELAYWMGLLVGDGCVSISKSERKQRVNFVNEDVELLDSFEKGLSDYFVDDVDHIDRRNRKNKTWEMEYFCKKLVTFLLQCGLTKTTAVDKKVPYVVRRAPEEYVVAFLRGLFDTDGNCYIQHTKKYKSCAVSLATSSLQLSKEVHSILLNLGIVSTWNIDREGGERYLNGRSKKSKCATSYKVRITGRQELFRFRDTIGFGLSRKSDILNSYLDMTFSKDDSLARDLGLPKGVVDDNLTKCVDYSNQGLYFVKPVSIEYLDAPTIDIEVDSEHCYWSNGFISHNSKLIFHEIEKLYNKSPIVKEASEKRPTRGSDVCYLKFKSVGGYNSSYIEALPLGDGSKIRGSRFYLLCLDELAQIPDKILDMVIRPMGATVLEPMENVRRLEQQNLLISQGLAVVDDFEEGTANKMVMTSSGYFKFNHMWRRMKDYWRQMEIDGDDKSMYAVHQVPFWELPEGFCDADNIKEAKRVMSNAEYRMEYEAVMVSDSEGFFKASLLEACTSDSGVSIEFKGASDGQYVMGMDPNQGGSASCGAVIIRMGSNIHGLVNVIELKKNKTQEMAEFVQKVCDIYNISRIYMDKGGGGKAICDLLEEGYNGKEPIIDRANDDHKLMKGRHILEMVNFNPAWISDANFATLALLEDKKLKFPEVPVSTVLDAEASVYESIKLLKSQLLNIIVTQTSSGLLHFDTPKKGQNKDLYSALILAAHGVRLLEKELEEDPEPVLHNKSGMVRTHDRNSWTPLTQAGPSIADRGLHAAILQKKN